MIGTTGVVGKVEIRVLVKGICAVDEGVKGGLWDGQHKRYKG